MSGQDDPRLLARISPGEGWLSRHDERGQSLLDTLLLRNVRVDECGLPAQSLDVVDHQCALFWLRNPKYRCKCSGEENVSKQSTQIQWSKPSAVLGEGLGRILSGVARICVKGPLSSMMKG